MLNWHYDQKVAYYSTKLALKVEASIVSWAKTPTRSSVEEGRRSENCFPRFGGSFVGAKLQLTQIYFELVYTPSLPPSPLLSTSISTHKHTPLNTLTHTHTFTLTHKHVHQQAFGQQIWRRISRLAFDESCDKQMIKVFVWKVVVRLDVKSSEKRGLGWKTTSPGSALPRLFDF